jgi:hypothetical protein
MNDVTLVEQPDNLTLVQVAGIQPRWGMIIGTLDNQTDLRNAINAFSAATALTGYVQLTGTITPDDSILSAIGKNAGNIAANVTSIAANATAITNEVSRATGAESTLTTAVAGKEPAISTGSTNQFYGWDKTMRQPTFSNLSGSAVIGQLPVGTTSSTVATGDRGVTTLTLVNSGILHATPATFTNTSGAWSATQTLLSQAANTFFGNGTGSSATPTFMSAVTARTALGLGLLATQNGILTPTAVKTSSYTAAENDFVPVDTTSGSVTITLPTAPADRTLVGIKHIIQGATNTVSIAMGGSDVFNKSGGATTGTIKLLNQALLLQYKSSTSIWYVLAEDQSLSQLDLRFLQLSNNLSDIANVGTARTNLGLATVASTGSYTDLSNKPELVTGISLATPSVIYNTPITFADTAGAWSGSLTLKTQTANLVFAGPSSGGATTPTFRSLVAADIPDISATYVPVTRTVNGHALSANVTVTTTDLGLATVATSGSYADLSSKPTIDTLVPSQGSNNGKFLTTNGTSVSWGSAGAGDALTAQPLSQFAATTSAQLAGVLSDETGTGGGFVRATSPTLTTPIIGAATGTSLTLTNGGAITDNGTGAIALTASGTNQNITLTPSGTGIVSTPNQIRAGDGTVSAPAWSLGSETNSGLYRSAAGQLRMSITGADIVGWVTSGMRTSLPLLWPLTGNDTGIIRSAAGVLEINSSTTGKFGQLKAGTVALQSLTTPVISTVTNTGTAGSTTYTYKVVAKQADGTTTDASAAVSTATGNATIDGTNYNVITWSAVTGATNYDVYRTAGGAAQGRISLSQTAVTLNDTGLTATVLTAPSNNATGTISTADGALGAPAYSFGSDPTTGLFRPTTSQISFTLGGTSRALLFSSGLSLGPNQVVFGPSTTSGTLDTGITRNGAGIIEVNGGNGGAGKFGQLKAGTIALQALANAGAPTVTPNGTTGAATWTYLIVAKQADGTAAAAGTTGSTATGNATLTSSNYNALTWSAVTGATSYDIYRTVVGTSPSTTGKIGNATTTSFNDTGLAGDSATAPTFNSTGAINGGKFNGLITPAVDNSYDLGSTTFRWRDAYIGNDIFATNHLYFAGASPWIGSTTAAVIRIGINNAETCRFGSDGSFLVGTSTNGGAGNIVALHALRSIAGTFANLPTAAEGMVAAVTDSTTVVWGATITGGGSNHVLAYYNGTNWTVAAK